MTRTAPPKPPPSSTQPTVRTVVAVRIPSEVRAVYEQRAASNGRRLSDELRAALSRELSVAE